MLEDRLKLKSVMSSLAFYSCASIHGEECESREARYVGRSAAHRTAQDTAHSNGCNPAQELERLARAARPTSLAVSARRSVVRKAIQARHGLLPTHSVGHNERSMKFTLQGCQFSPPFSLPKAAFLVSPSRGRGSVPKPAPNPSFKRTRLRRSA